MITGRPGPMGATIIYFQDAAGKEHQLFDCSRFIENVGRVPFQTIEGSPGYSWPEIIVRLANDNAAFCQKAGRPDDTEFKIVAAILAIKEICRTAGAAKWAEFGCGGGLFSYHLATILGVSHPDNHLLCLSDDLGGEHFMAWQEKMLAVSGVAGLQDFAATDPGLQYIVDGQPQLSYLAAAYDETLLQGGAFDLAVVNAADEAMAEAGAALRESCRLLKPGGLLLALDGGGGGLGLELRRLSASGAVEDLTEYTLSSGAAIFTARGRGHQ